MGVDEQDGVVIVQARTSTNRNNSNIAWCSPAPTLELRQWTVRDNQGGTTTVALQNPQTGAAMDPTRCSPCRSKAPRQASELMNAVGLVCDRRCRG